MMQIKCPKCGSRFSVEQGVKESDQADIQDIAAGLGEQWQLAWEYTDCFRQAEFGDVTAKMRWRLLKEIARLFETCTFQVRGKRYRTTRHEIVKAMTAMCNRHIWAIKSHGYLCAILLKTAERLSAERLTAREEQERENERQIVNRQSSIDNDFTGLSGEEARRKIVGIINSLGEEKNLEKR